LSFQVEPPRSGTDDFPNNALPRLILRAEISSS
jgi:hypothetical protein